MSSLGISFLVGVFILSCVYEYRQYYQTKAVSTYLDDLCNKWLLLTLHTSAEGVMSAAGFYHIACYYIHNINLLNISTALILLLGTLNEELTDYVESDHEHEDGASKYNDSITSILSSIDWLLVAILANYITGSLFVLVISIIVLLHQAYINIYMNQEWNMLSLSSAIAQRLLYFACCITAMCISVNAGMEFYITLSAPIYVIFAIMLAGTYVEGRVYFDQIYKTTDDHEHNELRIFSWLNSHITSSLLFLNTMYMLAQLIVLTTSTPINHIIIGLSILSYPYWHFYEDIAQQARPFIVLLCMITAINISACIFPDMVLSLSVLNQCIGIYAVPAVVIFIVTAYALSNYLAVTSKQSLRLSNTEQPSLNMMKTNSPRHKDALSCEMPPISGAPVITITGGK